MSGSSYNNSIANKFEALSTEYQICRRKLESKCEALLILSRELDQCRSERDQFKLMAEQLRDRYQMVKRQLTGDMPVHPTHVEIDPKTYTDIQAQSIARLLFDTKESNKALKFQVDDLKQKLQDAEGDIKLLREQIARSRVGTTDEGLNTRHFPAHEREALVKELEFSREEIVQMQRDLQQVLDEKEELVTERDAYRTKHERLNTELNYILGGDDKRIVDIDALNMENKFLQERLKQMEEEKSMAIATVSKYKSILEKKKTRGMLKLGQSRSGGLVITQKQVQDVIQNKSSMSPSPQALADLQGLCSALLDTINDKNLALSHQRKTNKLLGNRVSELEKKLKTLEVSGLWSVSGQLPHLEKLKAECEDIKTLVPVQLSPSHSGSESRADGSDFDSVSSSLNNSAKTSPAHRPSGQGITNLQLPQLSHFDLEELDLLPTKEEVVKIDDGLTRQEGKQRSISPLDASLGLSDFLREKDSSFLALTDGTNPTANKSHTMDSGFDQSISNGVLSGNISHSQEEEDGRDSIDSEKREAEIMRILRKESEEEVEDAHLHITGTDGTEVDDDDDDDDDGDAYVYDEASEHLQNLLASVTEKLLQRPGQEKNQNCEVNRLIVHKQKPHCGHEINNQQEQTVYLEENIKTLEEQGGILFAGSQDVTDQELLVDVKEHSQNELSVEVERQTNSQKDEESSRLISHVKQTDAGHVDKRAEQLYTDEQSKPSKC